MSQSDAAGITLNKLSKYPDMFLQQVVANGYHSNPGKVTKKVISYLDGGPALYVAREGVIRPSLSKQDTTRWSYIDYFIIRGGKIFGIEFGYRSDHGRTRTKEYTMVNSFSFCPSCYTFRPKPVPKSISATTSVDGTRKFCDEGAWVYTLKITNDVFVIKSFPSLTNKYFKNKSIAKETKSGKFVDGKLLSTLSTGETFELYKLKGNSLFRFYDETGEYAEFVGCN